MTFVFPDTEATRFDFRELLKDNVNFPSEYVNKMNSLRQKMCDALVSQPSSQALLDAIEEYLPYLQYLMAQSESKEFEWGKKMKIQWRSVLSKGIRMSLSSSAPVEKPIIGCQSIFYEATYLFLAYGFALANMANKRVGSGFGSAGEAACTEAADYLSRSAGVFRFLAVNIIPRWSNKPKDSPPECSSEVVNILIDLTLADAHRAALAKGEKRGMTPATLIKIGTVVSNSYEQCDGLLRRVGKKDLDELADPFISYVRDGAALADALLMKRFSQIKHDENENGIAVACITHANNQLLKCSMSKDLNYKKIATSMLPEVEEMRGRFVRINNNVTYQRVMELSEAKSSLPLTRSIVEIKAFTIPDIIEPVIKSVKEDTAAVAVVTNDDEKINKQDDPSTQ